MSLKNLTKMGVVGLALLLVTPPGCSSGDSDGPPLSKIRLFLVDDAKQWILELNPHTGYANNFFPAPTPRVSSSGCALAFDQGSDVLYFLDPSDQATIYRILPDDSGPAQVSALALPSPAVFTYDGFGFDSNYLLALDSGKDFIDALDPGTGVILESTPYCVDPLNLVTCIDLVGGLDATLGRGIYAAGWDPIAQQKVLHNLDPEGGVITTFWFEPGFDPQGIAVAKQFVFVSDLASKKIRILKISRQAGVPVLEPFKEIDFPPGANVSALAAGLR